MIIGEMGNFSLSSVLLFALVIPFMMTYRLGPGETPYWFFGIIFGLLLGYLGLDLIPRKKEKTGWLKSLILWAVIILVIGGAYFSAIVVRHQTAPVYQVHDIVLQLESAVQFFLQGENPYATTYFGTPLEQWHYSSFRTNPALYHFVMMPWYLLFSLPFYFLSLPLFGFFDGRMPLVFLFAVLLVLAWRLIKSETERRHLFLALLAFNPATLGYFLEGRGDIFMFAFLFWSWYWLEKERFSLAGIPLALAFATKQSSWPIFPFYFAFLWLKNKRNLKQTMKNILPFVLVFGVIVLPFFFWDGRAFLESTLFYLSGSAPHSYPVSGYGWGMVLHQIGIIREIGDYYPFWIWQLIICLPLGVILFRWLAQSLEVWRLITCYGIFTFVFWYFSRYFNNSHLGYLSMVFLTGLFWPKKER